MSISANTQDGREMSIENLNKVIDFLKRSKVSDFTMIGGEPTLHSRFEEVYDIISDKGFSVNIFSNGIIEKRRVEFLRKKDNLHTILLNINHPKDYPSQHWKMLNRRREKTRLPMLRKKLVIWQEN